MSEGERKPAVIGFDTSNYRTSVAAVTLDGEILVNHRELLPVPDGERGLRQSDAVFAHIRQLRNSGKELRTALQDAEIAAVAASTKPRDGEDSYMPVFQAGYTAGNLLAAALNVPFYETTHQRGHLAAALHGTKLEGTVRLLGRNLNRSAEAPTCMPASWWTGPGLPWDWAFPRGKHWKRWLCTEKAKAG